MEKIEILTTEQQAKLAEWRDRWTAIGLSTEPANRPEAERAIIMAYAAAKLPPPRIVWCDSPLSQGITRAIAKSLACKKFSTGEKVRASVGDSVWASVRDSVRDSVWASVGDSVWDSVRDSVRDSVGDSVRDSVGASVGDSVRASVRDSGYGQHDANWLGFYDYFREVCGLHTQTALLEGLTLLAHHAGWFLPHEKICWIAERPNVLHRDEQGRLHCENGPALSYPDKFSIWAWHGTRVSQQLIDNPDSITVEQIKNEDNAEVRRCMVERMGWQKFVELSEMKVLHSDTLQSKFPTLPLSELVDNSDPAAIQYGDGKEKAELLESSFLRDFEDRPLRFVKLTCPSTGRVYVQPVTHNETRVYAAVGRSFGMTEVEYKSGRYFRQGDVLMWALDQSDERIVQQHS
jgi:hypothetical protein